MLSRSLPLTLGYSVEIAPDFRGLAAALRAVVRPSGAVVVTNPTVRALHGAALAQELADPRMTWIEIPDGEAYKTLDTWQGVVGAILATRPDRAGVVLAFGGGVVGDLAGFAAATVLRGLPLVQVPTTLLAMVDASVGGKTGVNVPEGKNLVGAFHQPRLVWAALHTLGTLPARELRCGFGEIVKHAILGGEGALSALEAQAPALHAAKAGALASALATSIEVKARIVERDPLERGERALLNLGHTLGHAVETVAGYGTFAHGEAVAMGTMAAARLAVELGLAPNSAFTQRVSRVLRQLALPVQLPAGLDDDALIDAMGFDKKRERGMVKLVIPVAAGDVRVCPLPEAELRRLVVAGRTAC
ncbi:3-dehydroquinate synthase [Deltaproteobacteria bacterium]|nr:3-dehydroquinate synthase [Deltaproteobacteria bacterium]